MKEKAIYQQLHIKNANELERVLNKNNVYTRPIFQTEHQYFELDSDAEFNKMTANDLITQTENEGGLKAIEQAEGKVKPAGWYAILEKNNPRCKIRLKYRIHTKQTLINTNVHYETNDKKMCFFKKYHLDRGHLFAKRFIDENLIIIKAIGINEDGIIYSNRDNFTELGNMDNIYLQFRQANESDEGLYGQAHFEQLISNKFEKDYYFSPVFYKVQAIFKKSNNSIPIGNELLAAIIQENKIEKWSHVFIPNCDTNVEITDNNYFKTGDLNYLKIKNKKEILDKDLY